VVENCIPPGGDVVPPTVTVPATPANTTVPEEANPVTEVPSMSGANVWLVASHVPLPPTPGVAPFASQ